MYACMYAPTQARTHTYKRDAHHSMKGTYAPMEEMHTLSDDPMLISNTNIPSDDPILPTTHILTFSFHTPETQRAAFLKESGNARFKAQDMAGAEGRYSEAVGVLQVSVLRECRVERVG